MPDPVNAIARAVGWTLVQVAAYLAVFMAGQAVWAAVRDWDSDIARGILWWYAFWLFVGLALVANAVLEIERFGTTVPRRVAVWGVALVPLAVLTAPSASSSPFGVLLVWLCAVVAVGTREGLRRLMPGARSLASD